MRMAFLVNQPNIAPHEADFSHERHVIHKGCQEWKRRQQMKGPEGAYREPLFARVDTGPIQCELCGRRASKTLRRLLDQNCVEGKYHEFLDDREGEHQITFYQTARGDLKREGIKGRHLLQRMLGELT